VAAVDCGMDRRRQIRMREAELAAFLDARRTMICATVGPQGRPHLAALWYVPAADGRLDCWTYAASQKARNLERDPRATLLIEAGTTYQELRGVSMECDAELVRDPGQVLDIGVALAARYGGASPASDVRAALAPQAAKRVGVRFHPTRVSSWDHRKLG
jgi:PPOX class probable F420-dependent enzyme